MQQVRPLILLAGMGADARLFCRQKVAIPNLIIPSWIEPYPDESLAAYAKRLASVVDPGVPCFVGGASFGGIVALEMASHLQTIACFLIGSVRSPDQLPWQIRMLRPLCRLGPAGFHEAGAFSLRLSSPSLRRNMSHRLEQYARPDATFLRWASLAVLTWKPERRGVWPIYQIHGDRDRTLPVRLTNPDVIVPGGDHMLPFTSARQVNQFLHDRMHATQE